MSDKIKLSSAIIQAISASSTNHSTIERSDKELFLLAYKEYKGVDKKSRPYVTTLLNKQVETYTKSDNIKRALKRVFKLAFDYLDMQVICKFDDLEYTNVSNLVKLLKYIDKQQPEDSNKVRETIKGLYAEDMSPHRYNNVVAESIIELKGKYNLQETEGEFKVADYFNTVKTGLSKLNDVQLRQLLDMVQAKVDTAYCDEVEEVA